MTIKQLGKIRLWGVVTPCHSVRSRFSAGRLSSCPRLAPKSGSGLVRVQGLPTAGFARLCLQRNHGGIMQAYKFALIGITATALTACSTIDTRRADPPMIATTTTKTLAQFQGCFARQLDDSRETPTYLPNEHGGTYTYRPGPAGFTFWVLDLVDNGPTRSITLYAYKAPLRNNKPTVRAVEACL